MKARYLLLMLAFAICAFSQEGFAVLVNKDNPAKSISKPQLRKMMMGETPSWPSGAKVLVLLGPAGDKARGAAIKEICGMDEAEFAKYLLKLSFEGGSKAAPKTLPSAASVRLVLQLTPGALGIVDSPTAGPGSRVLPVE